MTVFWGPESAEQVQVEVVLPIYIRTEYVDRPELGLPETPACMSAKPNSQGAK